MTTDTFRSLMEATFDIAPQTPELPQVSERRPTPRPMLALVSGFAAVLLFVGGGGGTSPDPRGHLHDRRHRHTIRPESHRIPPQSPTTPPRE